MRIRAFLALLAVLVAALFLSCGSDTCGPGDPCPDSGCKVTVVTGDDVPVPDAFVEGGIDWTHFRVRTDSSGVAVLPGWAIGQRAEIHKDNFYPRVIASIEPITYRIYPTPARLERVGNVAGRSIKFDPDMLLTLEYGGAYHAYAYDESTVAQLAVSPLEAHAIIDVKMAGDTLWMSTHNDGVYAYSLEDRLSPVLVNHLEIPGYLEAIAVTGGTIAVSYRSGSDEVRIFGFGAGGQTDLLSAIPARNVRQMVFRSHYLVIIGYDTFTYGGGAHLRILDLADPGSPETLYLLYENGGRSGFAHEDYVLLGPNLTESPTSIAYTTIDITDPASPVYVGRTLSDTWLHSIHDESYGVGEYCSDYVGCNVYRTLHAVAAGAPGFGYQAWAILQERTADPWPCVHRPPLFVIGGGLWRLEENDRVVCLGEPGLLIRFAP